MEKTLLIACNNSIDARGLEMTFCNLSEIELLPIVFNGIDAVDTLMTRDVDMLLLDLFLPGQDGLEVLNTITQCSSKRQPLVFVMTSLPDDRLLYSIRDKIVYCFTKPLQYEIVQLRVLEVLHTAKLVKPKSMPTIDILDAQIAAGIRALCIPPHLKGHHYLREAIRIYASIESPTGITATRDIYPAVAKLHNTSASLVEHAIRNAVEIAWSRGNLEKIHDFFGYTVDDCKGKPTNMEFIATMAERAKSYIR